VEINRHDEQILQKSAGKSLCKQLINHNMRNIRVVTALYPLYQLGQKVPQQGKTFLPYRGTNGYSPTTCATILHR
jgi:hypothetical protein